MHQTLCILANIADGNTAKELIMTNDDMLQKIKYYMVLCITPSAAAQCCSIDQMKYLMLLQQLLFLDHVICVFIYCNFSDFCLFPQGHSNVKLQLAATFCVSNLIWNEEDGKRHTTQVKAQKRKGERRDDVLSYLYKC